MTESAHRCIQAKADVSVTSGTCSHFRRETALSTIELLPRVSQGRTGETAAIVRREELRVAENERVYDAAFTTYDVWFRNTNTHQCRISAAGMSHRPRSNTGRTPSATSSAMISIPSR